MTPTIIIDTREQRPLDFSRITVKTAVKKCWPGDYSLRGLARKFAIERKSVSDLVGTMKEGYAGFDATTPKRFDCTLLGLAGVKWLDGFSAVIVEPDDAETIRRAGGTPGCDAETQIRRAWYRAAIPPVCILAFVRTIRRAWRIPVIMATSREHAAEIVAEAATLVQTIGKPPKKITAALAALNAGGGLGE